MLRGTDLDEIRMRKGHVLVHIGQDPLVKEGIGHFGNDGAHARETVQTIRECSVARAKLVQDDLNVYKKNTQSVR